MPNTRAMLYPGHLCVLDVIKPHEDVLVQQAHHRVQQQAEFADAHTADAPAQQIPWDEQDED